MRPTKDGKSFATRPGEKSQKAWSVTVHPNLREKSNKIKRAYVCVENFLCAKLDNKDRPEDLASLKKAIGWMQKDERGRFPLLFYAILSNNVSAAREILETMRKRGLKITGRYSFFKMVPSSYSNKLATRLTLLHLAMCSGRLEMNHCLNRLVTASM